MQCTASNLPNDFVEIGDQSNAKALLAEIGLLGKFRHLTPSKRVGQIMRHVSHKTHWILAVLWLGHSNSAKDGYIVYCLPRSQFSPEMLDHFQQCLIRNTSDGSGDGRTFSHDANRN